MEEKKGMIRDEFQRTANRVSIVTITGNAILSVMKLAAGIAAHSGAMISDAVHSASDVFSTVVVMIGIRLAAKESDREHPYGHERLECVAAIILAMVLFATGLGIGREALKNILGGDYERLQIPGIAALAAAVGPMADILGETEPADTPYRTMRLRLKPEATVRETVTAVNETVELRSFGEVMPSMNEIFIRAVEGTL